MNRVFLKKVVKNPIAILLIQKKNNLNGNVANEEEDEDALKSDGDVDKNKPKVRGKKIGNLKSTEEELKSLG
jgi:hypothetical protein